MNVRGTVRPPGDKSITHRALLLAAVAKGTSELRDALAAGDTRSMAACLRGVGAHITPLRTGRRVRVSGGAWRAPASTLDCGNSGTAARLLLGALAGHPFRARLTGDQSLRRRPMGRVTDPLGRMGALFPDGGAHLPLVIEGGDLVAIDFTSPVASAQLKSALLLAGLLGGVQVRVTEPWRSRDHTERMLRALGYDLHVSDHTVTLPRHAARPEPFALEVPADASSAAFLVAAALLAETGEVRIAGVGVNPTRAGYLRVLDRMGARIERAGARDAGGEPVADLIARPSQLTGTEIRAEEVPALVDEIPILAALASRAEGESVFRSVGELRVKESDRLDLIARNLRAIGARAEVQGEDLYVQGGAPTPRGRIETAGDHRLTMTFAVLARLGGADLRLSEEASAAVSYPDFFRDLSRITGDGA